MPGCDTCHSFNQTIYVAPLQDKPSLTPAERNSFRVITESTCRIPNKTKVHRECVPGSWSNRLKCVVLHHRDACKRNNPFIPNTNTNSARKIYPISQT